MEITLLTAEGVLLAEVIAEIIFNFSFESQNTLPFNLFSSKEK